MWKRWIVILGGVVENLDIELLYIVIYSQNMKLWKIWCNLVFVMPNVWYVLRNDLIINRFNSLIRNIYWQAT